jgi:CheY-like chemotaxis protein
MDSLAAVTDRQRERNMHNAAQSLIVVEDEPIISIMIEELVQELGWTVDGSAQSEAAAFDLLGTCSPQLALLDINLGLTTSLAVAASCRDRHIPIVFMTGYTASDIPDQCGDDPVLAKPFSPDALDRALRRALQKNSEAFPPLTPN